MRVTFDRYVRDERVTGPDGTVLEERRGEVVDAAHVRNYLEAREFFEEGGWTELQEKRSGGVIVVTTVEPDGTTRLRLFTPVRGKS